ncbi:hypothetical protein Q3G72_026493 [Acer saccharum]|nr:hypothetical protein Q3G72_026493 [Acer saccharum]
MPNQVLATTPIVLDALVLEPEAGVVDDAMRHVEAHDLVGAEAILTSAKSPAAALVRARLARIAGNYDAAQKSLDRARADVRLMPLVHLETGRIAWARRDAESASAALLPLFDTGGALAQAAAPVLTASLAASDPNMLLRLLPKLQALLPKDDVDAPSLLLEAKATAQTKLGQIDAARATQLERYLKTPVSALTPTTPPADVTISAQQYLDRIEVLLAAHRNNRAAEAIKAFDAMFSAQSLESQPQLLCRKHMAQGVTARKLHRYIESERELVWVSAHCQDEDLVRRASYLAAKVISIQDGLRAIEPIEAFVKRYPNHSMTDDVLFWAGDIYQRRNRQQEARSYYERIDALAAFDDQCSDARWRLAWMAYRAGDMATAKQRLERILKPDGCAVSVSNKARAAYWLGRVTEQAEDKAAATTYYKRIWDVEPLGFYAQQALPRLLAVAPAEQAARLGEMWAVPKATDTQGLCADSFAGKPAFVAGLAYLTLGLGLDAAAEFKTLAAARPAVISESAAASQGVAAQRPAQHTAESLSRCAHGDAHWRLRTEFEATLSHFPSPAEIGVWRAAYPLAFRNRIGPAEQQSGLPSYFLQALAREESAFNPVVVSWAEAYGLTQLLLSSAQAAGRFLKPPVKLHQADELLEPGLNARLGAALIGAEVRKFQGNLGLALAAYNAGDETASAWSKKFSGQEFEVFAEEISIQETRGYVQRVLKTFGIYRWLYTGAAPILAWRAGVT